MVCDFGYHFHCVLALCTDFRHYLFYSWGLCHLCAAVGLAACVGDCKWVIFKVLPAAAVCLARLPMVYWCLSFVLGHRSKVPKWQRLPARRWYISDQPFRPNITFLLRDCCSSRFVSGQAFFPKLLAQTLPQHTQLFPYWCSSTWQKAGNTSFVCSRGNGILGHRGAYIYYFLQK